MKDEKPIFRPGETKTIEWSEVHRRMEKARATIERGSAPSPDQKRAILKARANELARELNEEKTVGDSIEVLEFLLAHESYGIETSFVREVYSMKDLTPLPGTPPFVLGITGVRGEILSVIDIRRFFDVPETGVAENPKIIIVSNESMEFGILADNISAVRTIPVVELQLSLPALLGSRVEYLRGVTNDRMVILDAEKMVFDQKMIHR